MIMKNYIIINDACVRYELIFEFPISERSLIYKVVKNCSGIYCWVNKVNGKAYVGSAVNLGPRISDYYQPGYIEFYKKRPIIRAIKNMVRKILLFLYWNRLIS